MMRFPPKQIPGWWHDASVRGLIEKARWDFHETVAWIFHSKSYDLPPSELLAIPNGKGAAAAIVHLILDRLPVALDPSREAWEATTPFRPDRLSLILTGNALRAGLVPVQHRYHDGYFATAKLTVKRMRDGFAAVMAVSDVELARTPHDALAWFALGALCAGMGADKPTAKRFARLLELLTDADLAALPGTAICLGCHPSLLGTVLETARQRVITIPPQTWPDDLLEAHWDQPEAVLWLAATGGGFSDHMLAAARLCGHLAPFPEIERSIDPAAAYRSMLDRLEATLKEEYHDHSFRNAHATALRAAGTRPETEDVCRRILAAIAGEGKGECHPAHVLHATFASLAEPARLKGVFIPVIERLAQRSDWDIDSLDLLRSKLGITGGNSPLTRKLDELFGVPPADARFNQVEYDELLTLYAEQPFFPRIRDALGAKDADVSKQAVWLVSRLVRDAALCPELAFLAARAKMACVVGGKPFTNDLLNFDKAVETRSRRKDSRELVTMIAAEMAKDRINPTVAQPIMRHLRETHGYTMTARVVYRVDGGSLARLTKGESEAMLEQHPMPKYAGQTVRLIEAAGPAKSAMKLSGLTELVVMELDYAANGDLLNSRQDLFLVVPHRTGRSVPLSLEDARLLRAKIPLNSAGERVVRERILTPFDIEGHIRECHEFHSRVAEAASERFRGVRTPPFDDLGL